MPAQLLLVGVSFIVSYFLFNDLLGLTFCEIPDVSEITGDDYYDGDVVMGATKTYLFWILLSIFYMGIVYNSIMVSYIFIDVALRKGICRNQNK